jgi:hypothetical protein
MTQSLDERPARPTIAQMREVCQPGSVMNRRNAEHWAGRWYIRRVSIYLTRVLITAPVSPNQLTVAMAGVGVLAGAALVIPGWIGAILPFLLINFYLLLDCTDGELARWRRQFSNAGVYLDRVGHYIAEASVLVGAGFRAGSGHADGWAVLGCLAAVGALLVKAETDLVDVSRFKAGLPPMTEEALEPRDASVALLRRIASAVKIHRIIGATEACLVLLVAGVVDQLHLLGNAPITATQALVVAFVVIALTLSVVHLISVMSSSRLQ